MTEYWRNSPNYWCKYCAVYVRDTKLERQNHEATVKHQNAIKRSLRDLHRSHEREEREKERAQREIDRLNDVVAGSASNKPAFSRRSFQDTSMNAALKQQREQLAQMGVAIPSEFLSDMAMPGEWTATSSRVIDEDDGKDKVTTGTRKIAETEEEKEERDAVRGLFKKQRRWGRDSKALPDGEDAELDALLRGPVKLKLKCEQSDDRPAVEERDERDRVKEELEMAEESSIHAGNFKAKEPELRIKVEGDAGEAGAGFGPVVFKKRKPKGLRTK